MTKMLMVGAGVAIGALVGGAGGLLLAPKSGRENRWALKNKIEKVKNKVRKNHEEQADEPAESLTSRDADYLH